MTWKKKGSQKQVFRMERHTPIYVGVLDAEGNVIERGQVVGQYRAPGLSPEAAAWYFLIVDIVNDVTSSMPEYSV